MFMTDKSFRWSLLISLLLWNSTAGGQHWDSLSSVRFEHPLRLIKSDPLQHIYVNDVKGNVIKCDSLGSILSIFAPLQYGQITTMEPWPALRLFLYYENIQSYTFLDRYLTGEQFTRLPADIGFARLAAASSDNQLWVVDDRNFSLIKFDFTFNQISLSSPFNQLPMKLDLDPYQIQEYQNRLYMGDRKHGILVFDNIGNYLKTIKLPEIDSFNFIGDELYYLRLGTLHFLHLYQEKSRSWPLPAAYANVASEAPVQVLMLGNRIALAKGNVLEFWRYIP